MVFITSFRIQTALRRYVTKLKELGEKVNTQENSTTKRNPLLLQIRTLTRKRRKKRIRIRTKHQLIPSFYECSCRVDYEKSAINSQIACDLAVYLLKCFKIASTIRSDARPSPYGLDAFDILS